MSHGNTFAQSRKMKLTVFISISKVVTIFQFKIDDISNAVADAIGLYSMLLIILAVSTKTG